MPDHAHADLNALSPVDEWDQSLIGFEPSTQPVNPAVAADMESLRQIVRECRAAGKPHRIVRDSAGLLCVWRKATSFWDH